MFFFPDALSKSFSLQSPLCSDIQQREMHRRRSREGSFFAQSTINSPYRISNKGTLTSLVVTMLSLLLSHSSPTHINRSYSDAMHTIWPTQIDSLCPELTFLFGIFFCLFCFVPQLTANCERQDRIQAFKKNK